MAKTDAFPEIERELRYFPANTNELQTLSKDKIQQFNDKGFICPLDVYSSSETKTNRETFDKLIKETTSKGGDSYSINGWHRTHSAVYDIVTDTRIINYVQDIIGKNIVCWGTHYFCKMPNDSKRVSWHQDASYWPLTPSKTVTVWLAIDDTDSKNGAMQVVPGSHLHGQIDFEISKKEEENVLNQTALNPLDYGEPPTLLEMHAGQMSLHTDLLLHGSEPNRSHRRRCGFTIRYVPSEVRALNGWNENAIVCRGEDPKGNWKHWPRPKD